MTAGLKPYPAMTQSGVPWLGEVPAHWSTRRLRALARTSITNGVGESAQAFRDDWPRYIRITDIAGPRRLRESNRASLPTEVAADALLEPGDLLLAAVGATYGKSYLHRGDTTPACFAGYLVRVAPSQDVVPEFLSYWTESAYYWDQVNSRVIQSTIQNFSAARFKGLRVPLPPLPEQAAIVRFLDHADRRIRRYIRAKQKLIKLLEEQKQAIIDRAVTRGLDPDVLLRASGVEWLEDVPTHWDMVPNRALLRLERRLVGNAWGDYLLLSLTKRGVIPRDMENPEGKFPASFDSYQEIKPGDLVFCLFDIDETPRAVGLSTQRGMVTGAYTCFSCNSSAVDWVYLFYLAMDNEKRLKPLYTGLRKVITKSAFLSAKMPLPPASERTAILAHVEASTRGADEAADRARRGIDLLIEYRTRLIADVVTGKLDVRGAAAALGDETDEQEGSEEVEFGDGFTEPDGKDMVADLEEVEA